jgi:hypothetical protein
MNGGAGGGPGAGDDGDGGGPGGFAGLGIGQLSGFASDNPFEIPDFPSGGSISIPCDFGICGPGFGPLGFEEGQGDSVTDDSSVTVAGNGVCYYVLVNPCGANNATQQQQKQNCLNNYNNSAEGKATQFFSLYNLVTNFSNAWQDWTIYPGIKIAAATILNSIGQGVGTTEFLSVTGGASTVITGPTAAGITATEGALGPVTPFAIGGATALDVAVHVQCAVDPSLPPNGIPIAPK